MRQEILSVRTPGRGFVDLTEEVARVVRAAGVRTGLCHVFVQHTSASLLIQENADVRVRRDLLVFLDRIAPEGAGYEHDDEGPDDMPSHIKSSVTRTSESLPVVNGHLGLGTWQAVYLVEHRRAPHVRKVTVTVVGAE